MHLAAALKSAEPQILTEQLQIQTPSCNILFQVAPETIEDELLL
jgi:hypothetical protein